MVGGGVVGLCVAEALAHRDAEVTVLEAGRCGAGASAGNAGWITPGLSNPLPAPGTVPQAIRWMFNPRSPLLVRPVPRGSYLRWLFDFWRASQPRPYSAGLAAMVALTQRVGADFDALRSRASFEMHRDGLLFVGRSQRVLDAELRVLRDHQVFGYDGGFEVLDRERALVHEPALDPEIAGAIFAPGEGHVRPESLTTALVERLGAAGAEILEQTCVSRIVPSRGAWSVRGGGEEVVADRVVIASGASTASLLRPLGVRLPLEGAKGYSITVDDPPLSLRGPVYLLDAKVGVSPYAGALRLAGTLELGSRGPGLSRGRILAIQRAGERGLRGWPADAKTHHWAGFRPLLPDGMPAIGPVPGHDGLFVATGHSMLGITLAPTTAEVLAPVVLEGGPALELAPFSVARFGNRGGPGGA